jgi:hypothetical protein
MGQEMAADGDFREEQLPYIQPCAAQTLAMPFSPAESRQEIGVTANLLGANVCATDTWRDCDLDPWYLR